VLITSMAVVRERERGTLEQLVVTPIDKTSLMLGKIVPFLLVGYVQMSVILVLGRLLFDVPIRGSLAALYAVALPFIIANLGLGLFLSTLVRTQTQAMQLGFLFLLPNILLSGFMFPREAMPDPAQWLGAALPLTYFLMVLRGVLLKGVGLADLWRDAAILSAFSVVFVALSVVRFRKTVE
jgi:ABC-2 type transport system permease protein